ncbi:MAG TPA: M28 family metallopeptidase [Kofleriaceae bacterium]|nr:M28 family metallopeptidase [Kofleriaceae bacterium]
MRAFAAVLLLAAACGDDSSMTTPDAPDGTSDGHTSDGANGCMRPALAQTWLPTLLSDVITNIPAPRATATQRTSARNYLQTQLTQLGWSPTLAQYSTGANVTARIPATMTTTKRIIVGAHFDSVSGSPGANDNGTGTAAVLAIARYLADMTCRKVNVDLVFFDEEEVGLVGARAYSGSITTPSDIIAVHTLDQLGYDNDNDHRFEIESPTTALMAEYTAAAAVVGVPVVKTTTMGTDHEAFRDDGFAAVGITEEYVGGDTTPFRHTAQDTASTVKQSYLQLGAQLAAQVIMTELAP